jgi:hypothetical protein
MAKVKIQGHASGTGILTVTAPNTSSDRTITLPDSTGTILDENSSLPAANLTGTVASARITASSIANDLIDSQHYAAASIDNEHLADDAVGLAEMASGTDGNIISYDASGNPVAVATGTDGQVLTSAGAGAQPAFETLSAGKVLQVLWNQNSSQNNTTSTSWVDTNTIAITPASGSTLLFIHTLNVNIAYDSGAAVRIFRDGTTSIGDLPPSADADSASHFIRTNGVSGNSVHASHTATWFYVHGGDGSTSMSFVSQRRMTASSNSSNFQYYGSPSSLTIIEIGA